MRDVETFLTNISGKTRRATLNGRAYIIAPAVLITPGVLNGSNGPLFYPADEISKDPMAWNAMPIVVYHPTHNGKPVSARDPAILEKQGIGHVYNATTNGKLTAEAWFDEALTRAYDLQLEPSKKILPRLERGESIELSTGLFLDQEAHEQRIDNGKPYSHTARGYRPDHLAVLPDQVGACSINDGCGVNVNADEKQTIWNRLRQLVGLDSKSEVDSTGDTNMDRNATIAFLTANCTCWKGEEKVLNQFADDKLAALQASVEKDREREAALNALRTEFAVPAEITLNAMSGYMKKKMQQDMDDEEEEEDMKKKKTTTNDAAATATTTVPTYAEWLATAPAEVQEAHRESLQIVNREKAELVKLLTVNISDPARKQARAASLASKPLDELRGLLEILPPQQLMPAAGTLPPHYLGAAGMAANVSPVDEDDILPIPVINWAEQSGLQRKA